MKNITLALLLLCLQSKAQDTTTIVSGLRWETHYVKSIDTIPESYLPFNFALKWERKEHADTLYQWNHMEFLRNRVEREIKYWEKVKIKAWNKYEKSGIINHYLDDYLTAIKRIYYWNGVHDALTTVIFNPYSNEQFDIGFKVK
jgi:hypothetical protein